jgi:hypothetical protein
MSIISFTCNKSYFYILIYYISEIGGIILENIKKEKNENVDLIVLNMDFQFMKIFILIFADLLILPFIIYTKCSFRRSKEKRKGSKGSKNEIQLIHNKPTFTKSKGIVVTYTILISFLDLFSRSVYFIFFLLTYLRKTDIALDKLPKKYNMDYIIAIDIIFRYLLSRTILKAEIYKHHKVSSIICLLGFVLLIFIDFKFIDLNLNNAIYMLIISLRAILFPLEDTINKILFLKSFYLPHYLMFNRGICEFVAFSFITIILKFCKIELFEIKIEILTILIYAGLFSVKAFCLMEIIYIFNPQYVSFLIISETFREAILMFLEEKGTKFYTNILEVVALTMVLFGTLMYNEIFIINLCGLEAKTKKNLTKEQREEMNEPMMTYTLTEKNLNLEDENN